MAILVVRFTNSSDFVGDGIDVVTDGLVDHAELGTKELTWIGARSDGGVQERPYHYSDVTRDWRYPLTVTEEQYDTIIASARADIGMKYDYSNIFGILFHSKTHSSKKTICSRFTIEKLAVGGIHALNVGSDFYYKVSPTMLHLSPIFRGLRQDFLTQEIEKTNPTQRIAKI